jgi:hypothetical protein
VIYVVVCGVYDEGGYDGLSVWLSGMLRAGIVLLMRSDVLVCCIVLYCYADVSIRLVKLARVASRGNMNACGSA